MQNDSVVTDLRSEEGGDNKLARITIGATGGPRPDVSESVHSEVVSSAAGLYRDGHYDDAVRKASQRFMNRVGELTDYSGADGVALMNKSFSEKGPLLAFNDRETMTERDEHNGYRFLAAGLTHALRNVLTHEDDYGLEANEALEWLAFISAMHRRLDRSVQIPQEQSTAD